KTIFFNSHVLSDIEQICDRIAFLALGELICQGPLDELLGTTDAYQATVAGGNSETLAPWMNNLTQENHYWHGQLKVEPNQFVAQLDDTDARLVSIQLARPSLEEFFMQQLRERGIEISR
ncbi:MAG: multidrug ABC transporter ATP-binding protein, partial [Cyanobacteria bacterium J06633_1]